MNVTAIDKRMLKKNPDKMMDFEDAWKGIPGKKDIKR